MIRMKFNTCTQLSTVFFCIQRLQNTRQGFLRVKKNNRIMGISLYWLHAYVRAFALSNMHKILRVGDKGEKYRKDPS